ncbi:MAG TPA: hemerythrin domain-containing protein [Chitinispirillaceae bacterium]|jgi:hemerythrin-like domain-containing protein|nr:hemerythrin domain-containing protein [Chitinispirillaceae bacterium]
MHPEFYKQIRTEHNEVKQILNRMLNSSPSRRETLIKELKVALVPHLEGEEKVFYPVLDNKRESHEIILEALLEHRIARNLFNELMDLNVDADDWIARTKVLKDIIEHHIEEEESEIFQAGEKLISHEQISQIYEKYIQEEKGLKDRLAA